MNTKIRVPAWLPYLNSMEVIGGNKINFKYKGGELTAKAEDLLSVMIYGEFESVNTKVIDILCRSGVPVIWHRRNMLNTLWMHSGLRADKNNLVSLQILARENEKKRRHIARRLLEEKLKSSKWLIQIPDKVLRKGYSVDKMRNIEAIYAKKYWDKYYEELGVVGSRRGKNDISFVLNGVSKFLSGIVLRWVTYHHLSPFHGFLHVPTDYPSLVYDLLEPYRGVFEELVFKEYKAITSSKPEIQKDDLLARIIETTKEFLLERVYCDLTRQIVYRQEIFHGIALALRSYLLGESTKFCIPVEGYPNGGRPRKIGFKMYGRHAGITNTWLEAKQLGLPKIISTPDCN